MNWEWIERICLLLGGAFGGGWFIRLYNAKSEKNALEIANLQKVITTMREQLDRLEHRLEERDERIDLLEERVDRKHEVIFSAFGCKLVKMPEDCVVIKQWHEKCEKCEVSESH